MKKGDEVVILQGQVPRWLPQGEGKGRRREDVDIEGRRGKRGENAGEGARDKEKIVIYGGEREMISGAEKKGESMVYAINFYIIGEKIYILRRERIVREERGGGERKQCKRS